MRSGILSKRSQFREPREPAVPVVPAENQRIWLTRTDAGA